MNESIDIQYLNDQAQRAEVLMKNASKLLSNVLKELKKEKKK